MRPGPRPRLYRGLNGLKARLNIGDVIGVKEFAATSRKVDVAMGYAMGPGGDGLLLQFRSWNKGADVSGLSKYSDEAEVVLLPYQQYRVVELLEPNSRRPCHCIVLDALED